MMPRILNWQGLAGILASLGLLSLVIAGRVQIHHWRSESARFEKLYAEEQLAFAKTTDGYRQAAEAARTQDRANAARVLSEQRIINERTDHDFQTRLAAARAAAARLQSHAEATADPGAGRTAPMPGLPAAAARPAQTASEDGLPSGDALTATEQAIQLDELIAWVKRQAAVDPNNNIANETMHP